MGVEEAQHLMSVAFKKLPDNQECCSASQFSLNFKEKNGCLCESIECVGETPSSKCAYSCRLLHELTVQVCKIGRCQSVLGKICSSSYLRKWYSLRLVLTNTDIRSKCCTELSDFPIPFLSLKNSKLVPLFDDGHNYMIEIQVSDGSLLIKTFDSHVLNQFLHALNWKRRVWDFERSLKRNSNLEYWSEEIKDMVEYSMKSPIMDPIIKQQPFSVAAKLFVSMFQKKYIKYLSSSSSSSSSSRSSSPSSSSSSSRIASLFAMSFQESFPLAPSSDIRSFFFMFAEECFMNEDTREMYFYVLEWIIKHNTDFYKNPTDRCLVLEYIRCSMKHVQDIHNFIHLFVARIHGTSSRCPHLRILHNLFSIITDVINKYFTINTNNNSNNNNNSLLTLDDDIINEWPRLPPPPPPHHHHNHHHNRNHHHNNNNDDEDLGLVAYLHVLQCLSIFVDWRQELVGLMQSIPFCVEALSDETFIKHIKVVMSNVVGDGRCSIHQSVLGSRPGKSGWFELCAPWGEDDGGMELHCKMLEALLGCCCHRRKFFTTRRHLVPHWLRMADKKERPAIKALCGCIEFDVLDEEDDDLKEQVMFVLEGSEEGRMALEQMEERGRINYQQQQQQSGSGPRKLSLPSKSTDHDLKVVLSSGDYKHLEALSLAFTRCTGSSADAIINLSSLKELNLWSTQFDDSGLQLICEHLHKLESLNLCETSVTGQGIMCLAALKNLRKLNLNSTNISLNDFERLRELLPDLQEVDLRYTDAWMSFS